MSRKPGLRELREAEVKAAFFRAAMELFRERGVDETSVEEIARRAGYSRATFFNHFGTKKGIFRYYGQSILARVDEVLDQCDPTLSPLDRLQGILLSMAQEADAREEDLKLVFLHSLTDPDYLLGPTAARMRLAGVVTGLVAEAQEKGQVRKDMPAQELAFHVLSLYHSAVFALVWGLGEAESTMKSAWRFLLYGVSGGNPVAD